MSSDHSAGRADSADECIEGSHLAGARQCTNTQVLPACADTIVPAGTGGGGAGQQAYRTPVTRLGRATVCRQGCIRVCPGQTH